MNTITIRLTACCSSSLGPAGLLLSAHSAMPAPYGPGGSSEKLGDGMSMPYNGKSSHSLQSKLNSLLILKFYPFSKPFLPIRSRKYSVMRFSIYFFSSIFFHAFLFICTAQVEISCLEENFETRILIIQVRFRILLLNKPQH